MKSLYVLPFLLMATSLTEVFTSENHALFVKNDYLHRNKRETRQTNADQMVQNILQWLQGVYTQNSRRSRFTNYDTINYRSEHDAFRQGTLREYLPPSNTQKPRPFEPVGPGTQPPTNGGHPGYPPSGSITPQPPFPIYTNPATGGVTGEGYPSPTNDITPPQQQPNYNGYPTSQQPEPPFTFPTSTGPTGYPSGPSTLPTGGTFTGYPQGPSGFSTQPPPSYTTGYPSVKPGFPTGPPPGFSTERPGFSTQPPQGYPTDKPGFQTQPPQGYPSEKPGFQTQPPQGFTTGYPSEKPGFSTQSPPAYTTGYPSDKPGFPTFPPPGYSTEKPVFPTQPPTGYPSEKPGFSTQSPPSYSTGPPVEYTTSPPIVISSSTSPPATENPTHAPSTIIPETSPSETVPTEHFTSAVSTSTQTQPEVTATTSPDDNNIIPSEKPKDNLPSDTDVEEDLKHPPHIHAIDVQCAKEMMTINIEFNRQFDGVIYSKGYYNMPECRYVKENSGQNKYSFTVNLNTCGTEFINAFDTQGQSYLENVLVLQNEPGIQEVWDTIRSVRCLWEGSLKESLSVALSVGMLSQEIVTFSGDTAMAKLDIQLGKGPFAQPANGLVKIGEPMTLVVSVSGDPGFDIQVKDCRATDSTGDNIVPLTDDNGCVLKPKLFGAFQKTRNTGTTGASIIAYAFFSAFKFPDVMDLMIECNIELCKTDCEMCSEPNQKIDPGRRKRRDLYSFNQTLADGVTMGKHIRVILPEDITDGKTIINLSQNDGICMTTQSFVFSSALLISLLASSCLFSAYMWLKNQRMSFKL